jgi:hypothetical protein
MQSKNIYGEAKKIIKPAEQQYNWFKPKNVNLKFRKLSAS